MSDPDAWSAASWSSWHVQLGVGSAPGPHPDGLVSKRAGRAAGKRWANRLRVTRLGKTTAVPLMATIAGFVVTHRTGSGGRLPPYASLREMSPKKLMRKYL